MLHIRRFPLLLLACTIGVAGLGAVRAVAQAEPSAPHRDGDRRRSAQACADAASVRPRFARDMRTKDLRDVLALYAADAVFVQPSGTRIAGRHALRNLYVSTFATYDSNIALHGPEPHAVSPGSPSCIDAGRYDETLRVRTNGTTMHVHGGYRFTFTRGAADRWVVTEMRWTG